VFAPVLDLGASAFLLSPERARDHSKFPASAHAVKARSLWVVGRGRAEVRQSDLPSPADGSVRVRALVSGISRGTERIVYDGRVPQSEWKRMRCPFQEGDFPHPVKYGYAMVGEVDRGPSSVRGRRVFCLHPHQTVFDIPLEASIPIPHAVPSACAALAPQMETALLAARMADVVLIDRNPARAAVAAHLGLRFALPRDAPREQALVFHSSGTGDGLDLALELCAFEASVIELSWFGDAEVPVRLGGAFHSRRLTLKSSQVGSVAPSRRAEHDHRRRLEEALQLCGDPRLDILVRESTPFEQVPARLGAILNDPDTLCHLIDYGE
jgi:hypothetical protein